jgi:AcrR family transcriptional regulator
MTVVMTMVTTAISNRRVARTDLRQRILDTSLTLFRERGFDATSIEVISLAAGVAKGTFFNFFPSKSAVLVNFYEELDAFAKSRLRQLDPGEPEAALRRHFRALERRFREEGDLAGTLFRELSHDPSLAAMDVESGGSDLALYEAFFRRCQTAGTVDRGIDPALAAQVLQDIWSASVQRWFQQGLSFSLSRTLSLKLRILFVGLRRVSP